MRRRIVAGVVLALALTAAPAQAAPTPIVVWADATRAPVIAEKFKDGVQGHPVTVVTKDLKAIKAELLTVAPEQAPDIIWADNEWTGELAAAGKVAKLPMSAALKAQFPPAVLDAFRFGFATYGLPVQFENVALITNATLVPVPVKTFAELQKKSRALMKAGQADVGIAVAQGPAGNAYFMNPLFTGLGGYLFGKNAAGSLDPYNVGIDNADFQKNLGRIDKWSSSGLINSTLGLAEAEQAFTSGRAPFWITGPWSTQALKALTFKYYLSPVPTIVSGLAPAPYLGVKGFMVTTFAEGHGVLKPALAMVRKQLSGVAIQSRIAALTGRAPANVNGTMDRLAKAFAVAGARGIPYPNIPQAASTWAPLGKAWASSTAGAGSVPASQAFAEAQATVVAAIG